MALVVTFHPDADLWHRMACLEGQVSRVCVVDNGSETDLDEVLATAGSAPFLEVIRNPTNLGVATALNQGFERAAQHGADWVLTLDQDTTPLPGLVAAAARVHDSLPARARIALISAEPKMSRRRGASAVREWNEVTVAITAGSMVSTAAHATVGRFRDEFFTDYVDIEFCLRARRRGYRVVSHVTPTLEHRIGEPTSRTLVLRRVTPTHHSAVRRYFITRNRIRVWLEYTAAEPRYVLGDVVSCMKELVKLCLFEEDRGHKLRSIVLGARDGLRGRLGPMSGHQA